MTLIKLYCGKGSEDSRVSFIGQAGGRISGWVLGILFHTARPVTDIIPSCCLQKSGERWAWWGLGGVVHG